MNLYYCIFSPEKDLRQSPTTTSSDMFPLFSTSTSSIVQSPDLITFNDSFNGISESSKTDSSAEILSLFDKPVSPYQPQSSSWGPQMSSGWAKNYNGVYQNPYNNIVHIKNNMNPQYSVTTHYSMLARQPSIYVHPVSPHPQQPVFSRQSSSSWNGSSSTALSRIHSASNSVCSGTTISTPSPLMYRSPSLQTNSNNMFFGNNFNAAVLSRNNSLPTHQLSNVFTLNQTPLPVNGKSSPPATSKTTKPSLLDEPLQDLMTKKGVTSMLIL